MLGHHILHNVTIEHSYVKLEGSGSGGTVDWSLMYQVSSAFTNLFVLFSPSVEVNSNLLKALRILVPPDDAIACVTYHVLLNFKLHVIH